jgi:hypothetical protein
MLGSTSVQIKHSSDLNSARIRRGKRPSSFAAGGADATDLCETTQSTGVELGTIVESMAPAQSALLLQGDRSTGKRGPWTCRISNANMPANLVKPFHVDDVR